MSRVRQLLSLIRPYSKLIIQSTLASLVMIIMQLPTPYFTRILIDNIFPNQDITLLGFIILIQVALALFNGIFGTLHSYFQLGVGLRMSLDVGERFLKHLEKLSFSFYDERRTGELLSRFADAHGAINSTVNLLSSVFLSFAQLSFFPLILFLLSWKLTLLALLVYPLDIIVYREMNKRLYKYGKLLAERRADFQAKLFESLAGIRTIQALGIERHAEKQIVGQMVEVAGEQLRVGKTSQLGSLASGVLRACGTALFTWFGWRYVIGGEMSLGTFMAFTMYLGFLSGPIHQLFSISQSLQQTLVHTNRFFEIYDLKPDINDPDGGAVEPGVELRDIRLVDVNFRYGQGGHVLRDINLTIPAGTMTALVGRSGAGKTTLINLLPRFYDPSSGYVLYGDQDLRDYQVRSLRDRIGYVMQSNTFFYGTILSELTLGDTTLSMDKVEEAARRAHIHEFIVSLPQGYQTHLSESGINLSQGQLQRLALARVFLQDRPILILDEPTSALDYESEDYIKQTLEEIRKSRTVIIIAHRLSTIESADKVVVLDHGRIMEEGAFSQLSHGTGAFTDLYRDMAMV